MDTKLRGDIAEQAVILHALRRDWRVLRPVGDRLPYDLVFQIGERFVRIQVKHAWRAKSSGNFVVDSRRTRTNRRIMRRDRYRSEDIDFIVVFLDHGDCCYVFPVEIFNSYKSEIHIVEIEKRQRKPRSAMYRDAWGLIEQWAAQRGSVA